ncbi:Mut7-C RNAse domain-containing protein [Promethearchaeum syntrophicum]|uniref:Mut7-C RNAse domain-containing protein n=1 Tax=Promethearchaeum syntrophicum TaxID=2594042 RepID=A0A5B9DAH2_9ARCH
MNENISPLFIVDAMFGKLGKFLRLLGFDTEIANSDLKDSQIFEIALKTNRILITRDKKFYETAQSQLKKRNLSPNMALFIPFQEIVEELVEIFSILGIDPESFIWKEGEDIPFQSFQSRCSMCNHELIIVEKISIIEKIPLNSATNFMKFWQCTNDNCGKIYWIGRHWEDIRNKLIKVKRIMQDR